MGNGRVGRRQRTTAAAVVASPAVGVAAGSWFVRHLRVGFAVTLLVILFWWTRGGWDPMHAWNRALADASLVLLVATLAVGPVARLWSHTAWLVGWRREIGNWSVFTAVGHVVIVLAGWVEWEPFRLFYTFNPSVRRWVLDQGFALGNILGILALLYGFVLLATSNDASIRLLGGSAWKYLQQSVYVLYALVAVHTAYFLFLQFQSFHRPVPPPNWLQLPFLIAIVGLLLVQTAAFVATLRRRRKNVSTTQT